MRCPRLITRLITRPATPPAARPVVRLAGLSLLALLPLGLVTAPAGAATASDAVALDFDGAAPRTPGAPAVDLSNSGTAVTVQQVLSSGGGVLAAASGADGSPGAVRFPAYDGSSSDPGRAIIAVTNAGKADALDPGAGAFSFGADVRLAATNHGSATDNGNNIIQRGLYTSGAQYKLQLDGSNAGCRILGDDGDLLVKVPVPTRAWYRLACDVSPTTGADTVTVTATPINADGSLGTPESASASGPIGPLDFPVGTPLSIGGKLTPDLTIVGSADQFNGTLDNAFLQLG